MLEWIIRPTDKNEVLERDPCVGKLAVWQRWNHSSVKERTDHSSVAGTYKNWKQVYKQKPVQEYLWHCCSNSQKVESAQISFSWGIGKQNVFYPYNGILLNIKRNGILIHAATWVNFENILLGKSQTKRILYCTILFVWNIPTRQIHRVKKQLRGCQDLGVEKTKTLMGLEFPLRSWLLFWN